MIATKPNVRYTQVNTVVGPLWIGYDAAGICLSLLRASEDEFVERCQGELRRDAVRDPHPALDLLAEVQARLDGGASPAYNLAGHTDFQRAVLEAVAAIPRGQVRSYGQIAEHVGHPGAARAVGEVMRTNPIPVLIPCHRVVRADGSVGRYTPDPALKRRLLEEEGALRIGVGG